MVVLSVTSGLLLSALYFNPSSCNSPSDDHSTTLSAGAQPTSEQACLPAALDSSYYDASSEQAALPIVEWKAANPPRESFWDNWAREFDAPVLSSNVSSSFYGLGVWMPEKFADDDLLDVEEVKELIKKYGLQMSFGIGGTNGQSPRLRFDYRWHEDRNLEDVFIQVEIPFQ